MAAVIEARDLRRTYRTSTGILRRRPLAVEAVRGISFEVAEGEPQTACEAPTIKVDPWQAPLSKSAT